MNFTLRFCLVAGLVCAAASAQAAAANASSLAGSDKLVTVVLKNSGVEDPNLRIIKAFPDHFRAEDASGKPVVYMNDAVKEIRVQSGRVETAAFELPKEVGLSSEDQGVLDAALDRAGKIFGAKGDDQQLNLMVAGFLAAYGNADAKAYLEGLTKANDIETQLNGAFMLYFAGETIPQDLILSGLKSGNRNVRGQAAILAGLTGLKDPALHVMLSDRIVELSAPAARALARLGDQSIITELLAMLDSPTMERHDAAIFALTTLGGNEVIAQMKALLAQVDASTPLKERAAQVLFKLDDPAGKEFFQTALRASSSQALDAALLLAPSGDWSAVEYLFGRLQRREDPTPCNQLIRAQVAIALVKGGDPSAIATLQELLNEPDDTVYAGVSSLLMDTADRRYLSILKPHIDNVNPGTAGFACVTAGVLSRSELGERWAQISRLNELSKACFN